MPTCPSCGTATNPGASFCAQCGATLGPTAAPTPAAPAPRPAGVTIVSIVMIVFSALGLGSVLLGAIVVMAFTGAFATAFAGEPWYNWMEFGGQLVSVFLFAFAMIVIAVAILGIVTGIASLKGRSWAWAASIVVMAMVGLNGLGGLATLDAGGLLGLLAAAAGIWYYFQPEVRAWFQKPA